MHVDIIISSSSLLGLESAIFFSHFQQNLGSVHKTTAVHDFGLPLNPTNSTCWLVASNFSFILIGP